MNANLETYDDFRSPALDPTRWVTSRLPLPDGTFWDYYDPYPPFSDADPGPGWKDLIYDTSLWAYDAGPFADAYYQRSSGTTLAPTPVYATYFRAGFTAAFSPGGLALQLRSDVHEGVVFHLNGVEVSRFNLPVGPVTPATPAATAFLGYFVSPPSASVPAGSLNTGPNLFAVELHQNLNVSNDASFDCELVALAEPGGRVTLTVSAEDFDNDGMADSWERAHGLDFATPDAAADPDGDGHPNREEFLADTDPLHRASFLHLTSLTPVGKKWSLRLPVSAQRRYVLQKSADLQSWTDEGPPVTPTGAELEFIFPSPADGRDFHRVRVDFQFP